MNEVSVHKNEEKQSIEFIDQEGNTVIECFKKEIVYNQPLDNQQNRWLQILIEILRRKEIDLKLASVIGSLEFMQKMSASTKQNVVSIKQNKDNATVDRPLDILDVIYENTVNMKVKSKKRYGKSRKNKI